MCKNNIYIFIQKGEERKKKSKEKGEKDGESGEGKAKFLRF